jgi:hypothetical protein
MTLKRGFNMKSSPKLKFHEKSCQTCRYYRIGQNTPKSSIVSDCLLLGRTLSITGKESTDRERYCDGWKRRPKNWVYWVKTNPFWVDEYIPRKTQIKLRKRMGIKE